VGAAAENQQSIDRTQQVDWSSHRKPSIATKRHLNPPRNPAMRAADRQAFIATIDRMEMDMALFVSTPEDIAKRW